MLPVHHNHNLRKKKFYDNLSNYGDKFSHNNAFYLLSLIKNVFLCCCRIFSEAQCKNVALNVIVSNFWKLHSLTILLQLCRIRHLFLEEVSVKKKNRFNSNIFCMEQIITNVLLPVIEKTTDPSVLGVIIIITNVFRFQIQIFLCLLMVFF